MREKNIEQQLRSEVRLHGGLCEKWTSGSSGWPDRICLFPDGKACFVEVKAPGKVPRPLQLHRHGKGPAKVCEGYGCRSHRSSPWRSETLLGPIKLAASLQEMP